MFGRTNDPKIWDYIGAVNTFYFSLIKAENQLLDEIANLDAGEQVGEDFSDDISAALRDFRRAKTELARQIDLERRKQGA